MLCFEFQINIIKHVVLKMDEIVQIDIIKNNEPFICESCSKVFDSESKWKAHRKKYHDIKILIFFVIVDLKFKPQHKSKILSLVTFADLQIGKTPRKCIILACM